MLRQSNSIIMEGNLVRDPVVTTTPSGSKVCKFSVAHNRHYTVNDERRSEVSFFDVEVWNAMAEKCMETLKKGKTVRIAGRLKQDRWQDEKGQQHSRVKIVGNDVQLFSPVKAEAGPREEELEDAPTF